MGTQWTGWCSTCRKTHSWRLGDDPARCRIQKPPPTTVPSGGVPLYPSLSRRRESAWDVERAYHVQKSFARWAWVERGVRVGGPRHPVVRWVKRAWACALVALRVHRTWPRRDGRPVEGPR